LKTEISIAQFSKDQLEIKWDGMIGRRILCRLRTFTGTQGVHRIFLDDQNAGIKLQREEPFCRMNRQGADADRHVVKSPGTGKISPDLCAFFKRPGKVLS
jgi:hypothetical protein